MKKILLTGCSFSDTCGWDNPDGKIWWHHLDQRWHGHHTVTSLSKDGACNDEIYLSCINALRADPAYDLVVVQWSSVFRQNFYLTSSITGEDRVWVGVNKFKPEMHKKGNLAHGPFREHLIKNFLNAKYLFHRNLDYYTAMSEFLLDKKLPFIFIRWNTPYYSDMLYENFKDTSIDYKNEVLLWPVCDDVTAQEQHLKLHTKVKYLLEISSEHWLPSFLVPYQGRASIDFADDDNHPGVITAKNIANDFIEKARSLGYGL